MATVQVHIASYEDELVRFYMEYDDVQMRVTGFRVFNGGSENAYGALIRKSDRLLYGQLFPPGETFIAVPTNGQGRVDITDLGRGHFGNIEIQTRYPA